MNAVHGALETLTDIVQEVTDIQMPQVAPSIIPQMYKIFVDPQNYSISLRKMSLEIFNSLVTVISEMSEYDTSTGRKYLFPYMNDFVFAMVKALSLSGREVPALVDDSLKSQIVKTLTTLLKSYPKKLTSNMDEILAQVWSCLVQNADIYARRIVNSDTDTETTESSGKDSEGNAYTQIDKVRG